MNVNSTYQIGKDHIVCEDYALTGEIAGSAYAIVCDGCSASPDADFGARVLAMSAREIFSYKLAVEDGMFPSMNPNLTAERFGQMTINKAYDVCRNLHHLHPQALDATLLVAWVKEGKANVFMYGDGVMVHRTKQGVNTVHIHLTSGAPDYLSYYLDPLRRQAYENIEDNKKEVGVTNGGKTIRVATNPLEPYSTEMAVEPGDIIAVISDGINSFRRADNEPIPWTSLVDEFTGYKTTEGEFVLRRLAAFKRKCDKEGTKHSDDISVAAICI